MNPSTNRPRIAFGPVMPGWGSWEWVGADLCQALSPRFQTEMFYGFEVPACEVVVFVKHAPPVRVVQRLAGRTRVVYCPVDFFGSAQEIERSREMLVHCCRVVVHCDRLRRYFSAFAKTEYIDHHIKFVAPLRSQFVEEGDLLWVGVRSNLPPLVEWLQGHELPGRLHVLSNFEDPQERVSGAKYGFAGNPDVVLSHWSAQAQRELMQRCRGALDIKGQDFRAAHKPPAKAIDFLASGIPLAMNPESSPARHLRELGFDLASPADPQKWLSRAYWESTRRLGATLRERLSLRQVAGRWQSLLEEVLGETTSQPPLQAVATAAGSKKVALVSFLFNWPSTGGGIIHTVELATFLQRAGYTVQHFYAEYGPWELGEVSQTLPFPSRSIAFSEASWNLLTIQDRFRRAVQAFDPEWVIVTDSWNMKPLLAEALKQYRILLRLQAMEGVCPLNNVRLLFDQQGRGIQCQRNQLADSESCTACLGRNARSSGSLHRAEQSLCRVGSSEYRASLLRSFRDAEAVFVVNPLTEALVRPFTSSVQVVPAGMDPARFPWPWPEEPRPPAVPMRIFFAGLVDEWMKGFHVLRRACSLLWEQRQDFELVVTAESVEPADALVRSIGWQSQADLPAQLRRADLVVHPTLAQEGLGRSAVEAMAVGRPVVASRIGGLLTTVVDGVTGLLFESGNAEDLARKLQYLLDRPQLRAEMGLAGRRRFEQHYSWDVLLDRHYKPLLDGAKPS